MTNLQQVLNSVREKSPILYWIVTAHLVFVLGSLLGMLIDDRTLMGVNVWIKPLKFAISTGIYLLTVGFLITLYPYSKRKSTLIKGIVSWTLLIEIGLVVFQAGRGVQSHYNVSSPVDGMIFGVMGLLIAINVLVMALFIIDTIRLKLETSKVLQWAILLGWIVVFFGSWIGGQMIGQMSHSVGVEDGGPGLPLLNWSTIAGDLRVAHFFGLHGLQLIPLFAVFLSKKWKTTSRNHIIVVTVLGLAYAVWIGYTFCQAKKGIPFIGE